MLNIELFLPAYARYRKSLGLFNGHDRLTRMVALGMDQNRHQVNWIEFYE
jgi:hypothetical protein